MKTQNAPNTANNLNAQVALARLRFTRAETNLRSAQAEAKLARKRRKEAKQAAKRAKKAARRAKQEFIEAQGALEVAESKLTQLKTPASKPKPRKRSTAKPTASFQDKPTLLSRARQPALKDPAKTGRTITPKMTPPAETPAPVLSPPVSVPGDFENPPAPVPSPQNNEEPSAETSTTL
jgi:hypothetical protein